MKSVPRKLCVFLCHASQDKPAVRELYNRLKSEPWIDPWLDAENLLPGQDPIWESYKATLDADAIIICLSRLSVTKYGYVNRAIERTLEIAQGNPESATCFIGLRLDDCDPSFEQLRSLCRLDYFMPRQLPQLYWVHYFTPNAHNRLMKAFRTRAYALNLQVAENFPEVQPVNPANEDLDLYCFIQIPETEDVYSFAIGKYPVTNAQYQRFLYASDFADKSLWVGFPKYDEECMQIGRWHEEGWDWLEVEISKSGNPVVPKYWYYEDLGIMNPDNPVVGINWYEANAYCNWLLRHWNELAESRANPGLQPGQIRLPLDPEWLAAAGGQKPENRYPWDVAGKVTWDISEIVDRANVRDEIGHTTPVNAYPQGASTRGVMDMAGNAMEWQANYANMRAGWLGLRGCPWSGDVDDARVSKFSDDYRSSRSYCVGFRVVVVRRG